MWSMLYEALRHVQEGMAGGRRFGLLLVRTRYGAQTLNYYSTASHLAVYLESVTHMWSMLLEALRHVQEGMSGGRRFGLLLERTR